MTRTSPWPKTVFGVLLRDPRPEDVDVIADFRNAPEVNRWMVRTYVEPAVLRAEWLAVPTSETDYSCVAEVSGELAGLGFLDIVDGLGQPGVPRGTDALIGYMVRPGFEGRCVATATARGVLAAAFEDLGLRRVTAGCYAANVASARVLEKVGMRRERHGIADSWHAELGWIDGDEYGLLAHEWPGLR